MDGESGICDLLAMVRTFLLDWSTTEKGRWFSIGDLGIQI